MGWALPVRLWREEESETGLEEFSFYGPTCDDRDHIAGPFLLPADISAGDYIEIGMLGAYGCARRTACNGFGSLSVVDVTDEPQDSPYREDVKPAKTPTTVVWRKYKREYFET